MHNFFEQKYYFTNKFDTEILNKIDKQTIVIYRNYSEKIDIKKIIKLKNYCKKINKFFYLSNNIKLALKLNLDGAYIPSFNHEISHLNYTLKKKFHIIGSAHNLKEIRLKEKQRVSKIFLSSIFKKNQNYLGIYRFKLISKLSQKKIVALGGISKSNLRILKMLNLNEFASISFFE
tara:strand:- start:683 stop:1210 length:528 start_codon:yes stop_codon:yes gene_type:complete